MAVASWLPGIDCLTGGALLVRVGYVVGLATGGNGRFRFASYSGRTIDHLCDGATDAAKPRLRHHLAAANVISAGNGRYRHLAKSSQCSSGYYAHFRIGICPIWLFNQTQKHSLEPARSCYCESTVMTNSPTLPKNSRTRMITRSSVANV